jgi:hypothetical protein
LDSRRYTALWRAGRFPLVGLWCEAVIHRPGGHCDVSGKWIIVNFLIRRSPSRIENKTRTRVKPVR